MSTAEEVLARALASPPTLGSGRLVCVDGPSGSGKTTLARAVRRAAGDLTVATVHMDAVYDGWAGLEAGMRMVADHVVGPLRRGEPGRYRRYDWHAGCYAEEVVVPPRDLVVVEGVGAGNPAYADVTAVLVWCEGPADERLERAVERDGEEMREHLLAWRVLEAEMFARTPIRERADIVVA